MKRLFFSIIMPTLGLICIFIALMLGIYTNELGAALENQQIDPPAFIGVALWISGIFAMPSLNDMHPRIISALLALWLLVFGFGVCLFLNLALLADVSADALRIFAIVGLLFNASLLIMLSPRRRLS